MTEGLIPGRGQKNFVVSKTSRPALGPPSFLFSGCWDLLTWG